MLPIIHQQRWHLGVDILEHLHSDTRRASGAGRVTIVGADDYPNLLPKREWMRICKNCILRADRWLKVLTPEPSTQFGSRDMAEIKWPAMLHLHTRVHRS